MRVAVANAWGPRTVFPSSYQTTVRLWHQERDTFCLCCRYLRENACQGCWSTKARSSRVSRCVIFSAVPSFSASTKGISSLSRVQPRREGVLTVRLPLLGVVVSRHRIRSSFDFSCGGHMSSVRTSHSLFGAHRRRASFAFAFRCRTRFQNQGIPNIGTREKRDDTAFTLFVSPLSFF